MRPCQSGPVGILAFQVVKCQHNLGSVYGPWKLSRRLSPRWNRAVWQAHHPGRPGGARKFSGLIQGYTINGATGDTSGSRVGLRHRSAGTGEQSHRGCSLALHRRRDQSSR